MIKEYEKRGCKIIVVPQSKNGVNLNHLMKLIGEMGIDSVLLEGGGTLNYSALESKIVDEIHVHIAPKIFGGCSKSPVEGMGISDINQAIKLNPKNSIWAGDDLIIENEVIY